MASDRCKSCDQEVIWIEDQNGTKLLVNKLRVRAYSPSSPGVFVYWATPDGEPELVYISHFVTCPKATQHSKGGK